MRITRKHLDYKIERINTLLGRPAEPWQRNATANSVANVGNFHIAGDGKTRYSLAEVAGGGGEHTYGSCVGIQEFSLYLDGVLKGIELSASLED